MSRARLKTGAGQLNRLAKRWARRVLRPTGLRPHHFQHRSQSIGNEGGVGYLLASDLRYLRYLLSKNPFFVSFVIFCEFPFLFARPFFTCLN